MPFFKLTRSELELLVDEVAVLDVDVNLLAILLKNLFFAFLDSSLATLLYSVTSFLKYLVSATQPRSPMQISRAIWNLIIFPFTFSPFYMCVNSIIRPNNSSLLRLILCFIV
eukprot:TRINITY_DN407_c0_g1_i1.p1 TRINITY_DN407_c0_g1~~TRINITY_DN407_c0_g1_i1.p1  ORF type:complete len:112 (+),score=2.23 TRINITY_DN407_c0_g1_i1:345-680(+)